MTYTRFIIEVAGSEKYVIEGNDVTEDTALSMVREQEPSIVNSRVSWETKYDQNDGSAYRYTVVTPVAQNKGC